jgi:hypothetical protein
MQRKRNSATARQDGVKMRSAETQRFDKTLHLLYKTGNRNEAVQDQEL